MPSTPQLIKLHQRRWNKHKNTPLLRGGFTLALVLSIVLLTVVLYLVYIYTKTVDELPSLDSLPALLNPQYGLLMQPTQFYDRTGNHIIHTQEEPAIEKRKYFYVESQNSQIDHENTFSDSLLDATIAISDPTFRNNPGFSFEGINENKHNTIAQRLVSELLLWNETPNINRAIRERILAAQITSHFGREKVMEWYLNSADYGLLTYGANAAAQIYLGKSASELNLAEAATLAGISESPALNPFSSPQTALDRAEIVINAMEGQGLISSTEAEIAKKTKITFQEPITAQNRLAPQFIDMVWQQLPKSIPLEWIERGGYKVITSLDYDLQLQTECTIKVHLSRLSLVDTNQNNNQNMVASLEACPASKLLPTLPLSEETKFKELQTNVIVYDPFTSQIIALAGEPETSKYYNLNDGHPPGSLFTPFVYLTAFTRGFNPASLLWDIPLESSPIPLEQLNPEGQYKGPLRLRNALATDRLLPAAQLINQIGIENILKITRQLGLSSLALELSTGSQAACPGCQLLLGEGHITLVEAVQAFGVFSNQGYLVGLPTEATGPEGLQPLSPVTILSVVDDTNRIWFSNPQIETRPVISNQLAYLMTDVLSDESARWPSLNHPNPLEIGRPAAVKMGVSDKTADTWTVGFSPQLVVGVWLGSTEDPERGDLPVFSASALWHAIIQYAVKDEPSVSWTIPPGITVMDVCDPSGMLPTLECPNIVSEVFLSGQEPTQADNLYQVYQVNRETGRLATVFTPPDLVKEQVFLNIPPEADSWAESIDLETPPETYDLVDSPTMDPNVAIESPEMFAYLNGTVTIEGRAEGIGFESYRLQAGKGINPSGWIVIQEETLNPVSSGILGTWDTTGRNGLYAIQLIVLREDQQVDSITVQVTLDNEPPSIRIIDPGNLESFSAEINETITFLVEAEDNLGLNRVEYYLNHELIATQFQPPFAYPWKSKVGTMILKVRATDNAGNISESEISFIVN